MPAKIIDTEKHIEQYEQSEKLEKLKSNKQLHDLLKSSETDLLANSKLPPKISKAAIGKLAKARKPKQPKHVDLAKYTTKDNYTYKEFTQTLHTIVPNAINRVTFNNPRFQTRLNSSKDLKHSLDNLFGFEIHDDLVGGTMTIGSLFLEELVQQKVGLDNRAENEKVKQFSKEEKAAKSENKETQTGPSVSDLVGVEPKPPGGPGV